MIVMENDVGRVSEQIETLTSLRTTSVRSFNNQCQTELRNRLLNSTQ